MMVEVFRTNVNHIDQASDLIAQIQRVFPGYRANFDLNDCDRILRVMAPCEINVEKLISIMNRLGFHATVLPDVIPDASRSPSPNTHTNSLFEQLILKSNNNEYPLHHSRHHRVVDRDRTDSGFVS
jgi:hypothetical protein